MAITVEITGGGTVDFPDGTPLAEIKAAMDRNFGGGRHPGMDVQSALNDGHSKNDVMGELGRRTGMNYKQAIADGHNPDDVIKEMQGRLSPGDHETQYAGLPAGAEVLVTPGGNMSVAEEMDRAQGRWTPEMLHNALPSRKTITDFIRPTVEGGLMIGGGMVGAAAGLGPASVPGAVLGAGLGYATGKKLMDFAEGAPAPVYSGNPYLDPFIKTGTDVLTGATMEAGGQVVGNVFGYGINKLRGAKMPFTANATRQKAGQAFRDMNTTQNPELATVYGANQAESEALRQRVNSPAPLTPAQATGNIRAGFTEQSLAAKDSRIAETLKQNDAANLGAAADNLTDTLGTGRPIPAAPDALTIGETQRGVLQTGAKASKAEVSAAYKAVPDYQMPVDSFTATAQGLQQEFLHPEAQEAIDTAIKVFQSKPPTTKSLIAFDQYLSDEIRQAAQQGNSRVAKVLNVLKRGNGDGLAGLRGDFNSMGEAAQTGDIAIHNGQVVIPSKIEDEIAAMEQQIQQAAQQGASLSEQNQALRGFLAKNGETVMQNTGVTDAQFAKSLQARLEYLQQSRGVGLDYQPPVNGANQQVMENLQNGIASREAVLSNLQPAEDVAATYSTAHDKALAHFQKYGTDTVKKVLKQGDHIGGGAVAPEAIPAKFFTPSGARELVNTVGPQQAAQQMQPHITNLITGKALNADGTLNIQRAMAAVRANRATLDTLGLVDHAHEIIRGQVPATIRAELAAKGVDILGNPVMGAREAAKWVKSYAPAMKQIYGDSSREIIAMQDYSKMIDILSRNKNVSYSGGSNTIEKMMMGAPKDSFAGKLWDNLATTLAGSGIGLVTGGPVGALFGGAAGAVVKSTVQTAKQHQQQLAGEIFREAITNPAAAKLLMDIGRGTKVNPADVHAVVKTLMGYTVGR